MINEQDFYPSGGGRGNIVSSPADLPRWVSGANVELQMSDLTISHNGLSTFFDALNFDGAIANVAVAGTWVPIVDISGAGFLGNVVASHGFSTVKTVGIQVEVDGVMWEWIESLSGLSQQTLVLGSISTPATAANALFPVLNRPKETAGFLESAASYVLAPVEFLHSAGAPVLAFSQSLKVNVRNSSTASSATGRTAGCTFVLR